MDGLAKEIFDTLNESNRLRAELERGCFNIQTGRSPVPYRIVLWERTIGGANEVVVAAFPTEERALKYARDERHRLIRCGSVGQEVRILDARTGRYLHNFRIDAIAKE